MKNNYIVTAYVCASKNGLDLILKGLQYMDMYVTNKKGDEIKITHQMFTSLMVDGKRFNKSELAIKYVFMDQSKFIDHAMHGDVKLKFGMWYPANMFNN